MTQIKYLGYLFQDKDTTLPILEYPNLQSSYHNDVVIYTG